MKRKKAYIIDPYSHGSYHEVINQGVLMMVSDLYESVTYIAEKESIKNIKRLLELCNVSIDNVDYKPRNFTRHSCNRLKGLIYLLQLLKVSFLDFYYYLQTTEHSDVFYNNNAHFATIFINNTSFFKKNRVYIICHNELEWINPQKRVTMAEAILGHFYSFVFNSIRINDNLKFLLLSAKMAEYFKQFVSDINKSCIYSIDHCYIRPYIPIETTVHHTPNISIGLPGAININRGLNQLKELILRLKNADVRIYSISNISEHLESPFFEALNKTGGLLPFDDYNKYIKQMDAMLFLYATDSYKLTASGAVLEAIWNEKPIFALRNDYFSYLFDKFGPLGVLCDDVAQLSVTINLLTQHKLELFSGNLKKAKAELHPNRVKNQLEQLL